MSSRNQNQGINQQQQQQGSSQQYQSDQGGKGHSDVSQDRAVQRGGQQQGSNSLSMNSRRSLRSAIEDLFSDTFLMQQQAMRSLLDDEFIGFVPFRRLSMFPSVRSLLQDTGFPQDMWSDLMSDVIRDSDQLMLSSDSQSVSRNHPLQLQGSNADGSSDGNSNNDARTVYFQNIPQNATLSEIQQKLKPFGNVVSIQRQVASHSENNQPPQQIEGAVVVFDNEESARKFRENPPVFEAAQGPLRILQKEEFQQLKQQMSWPQLTSSRGSSLPAIGSRQDQQGQQQQGAIKNREDGSSMSGKHDSVQQGSAANRQHQQVGAADQQGRGAADRR